MKRKFRPKQFGTQGYLGEKSSLHRKRLAQHTSELKKWFISNGQRAVINWIM